MQGTVVITNLSSVLNDKNEWETPDTFNPGHFLNSQGQFLRREAFLPFSAGESHTLYLYTYFIIFKQKYYFFPSLVIFGIYDGDELKDKNKIPFFK